MFKTVVAALILTSNIFCSVSHAARFNRDKAALDAFNQVSKELIHPWIGEVSDFRETQYGRGFPYIDYTINASDPALETIPGKVVVKRNGDLVVQYKNRNITVSRVWLTPKTDRKAREVYRLKLWDFRELDNAATDLIFAAEKAFKRASNKLVEAIERELTKNIKLVLEENISYLQNPKNLKNEPDYFEIILKRTLRSDPVVIGAQGYAVTDAIRDAVFSKSYTKNQLATLDLADNVAAEVGYIEAKYFKLYDELLEQIEKKYISQLEELMELSHIKKHKILEPILEAATERLTFKKQMLAYACGTTKKALK